VFINLSNKITTQYIQPFYDIKWLLCLGITLSVIASNVYSLPNDSDQELTLEAVSAEFDETLGMTTYTGEVVMQQGSMVIRADKLVIYGKLDSANKVIATGKPAKFQQTAKIDAQPVRASANKLEYEVSNETLVLVGNAALDQEGSSLKSNLIKYDVKKALVKAGSKKDATDGDDRVRMVIPAKVFKTEEDDTTNLPEPSTPPNTSQPQ